jgi:RNA polymerase sigma-70 factor (ECF subfamily)
VAFWKRKTEHGRDLGHQALEHLDSLYGTAMRLTGNRSRAEDLVQDTFVRALRFSDKFDPGTNLRAWLYRIMFNLFINHCRRERRGREIREGPEQADMLERMVPAAHLAPCAKPEEYYFEKLFSDEVVEALDTLPQDFKLVVLLADINGFSYKQISDILGIPVGTVMSRLHRGRRALQDKLYRYAVAEGYVRPRADPDREAESAPARLEDYRRRRGGRGNG